ncbi:MAG: type II secretion system F family protein [Thermaerobacterales bacterium]
MIEQVLLLENALLLLVFIGAATFTTFLLAPAEGDAILRKRIREVRLDTADPMTVEERELDEPFSRRVLLPALNRMFRLLERLTPAGVQDKIERRLREAGQPTTAGRYMFVRVTLVFVLAGPLVAREAEALLFGRPEILGLLVAGAAGGLGWVLPEFWLSRLVAQRRKDINKALPDVLDLLCVSVEAGLGFDGAIQKVSEKFGGPTGREFAEYLKEVRLGKTREEALRSLADRAGVPDLQSFAAAVIQADKLGVSLGRVLRLQSEQMRVRRRQRAEEQAMATPIKMLFPLVMFVFPAIFIVLLGPAVIHMMAVFAH